MSMRRPMNVLAALAVLTGLAAPAAWSDTPGPGSVPGSTPSPTPAAKASDSTAAAASAEVPVVDEMPKPVKTVPPVYPESARKRQQQGTVYVQAKVLASGKVGTVRVIEGKGVAPDLDQAAVSAVKQWVFEPAKLKGKPVEAWVVVPIAFKLH